MTDNTFEPQVMGNGQRATNTVMKDAKYHISFERFNSYYGGKTTALVLANTVFLILSGDFKEAFAKAKEKEGLQACFDVFLDNLNKANHASDHHLILKGDNSFGSTQNATNILGAHNILRLHEAANKFKAPQAAPPTDSEKRLPGV